MTQGEVEDRLACICAERVAWDDKLHGAVAQCRGLGATWVQIGNVLGVTPQAVQQRFRG